MRPQPERPESPGPPPGNTAAAPPPRTGHTAAPSPRPEPETSRAAGPDPGPEPAEKRPEGPDRRPEPEAERTAGPGQRPEPEAERTAGPGQRPEPGAGRAAGPEPLPGRTTAPEPLTGQTTAPGSPAGPTNAPLVPRRPHDDGRITGAVVPGPPSEVQRRAAAPIAPRPEPGLEPSWGKVLGTTVQLWLSRRPLSQRLVGAFVALLVVFAAGGLTVGLIRHSGNGRPAPARPGNRGSTGNSSPSQSSLGQIQSAAAARNSAAVWVSTQVSHSTMVSCDPAMCAALEATGFPAGDLMALGPASTDPLGSQVVVSTAAVRSMFGGRLTSVYAPTVLASFGSGSAQVDVRAYAAGGAAAYLAALRSDQASRERVGRLLAGNSRVTAPAAARQQLLAGQVDSRLLVTIATLSHQGPVNIVAFGDSGPGAALGVPLREVEIASPAGAKNGYLESMLALVRAQLPPYLASTAKLTFLVTGQEVVQIVFDAPSPLGLLGR